MNPKNKYQELNEETETLIKWLQTHTNDMENSRFVRERIKQIEKEKQNIIIENLNKSL